MSFYSHDYGVPLVQEYIEDKSNEIPMGPELIKKYKFCQRRLCISIKEESKNIL